MKIMVTGGAGFIGSHICDELIEQGHQVVVVDNLVTGFKENVNSAAKLYIMSICDTELDEVFEQEKPEVIFHQAAQMIINKSVNEPILDAQENIIGGLNVILSSVRYGVRKVVYASSGGAVYGEPIYLPVDEKHPINPISQYGVSKHTVEHYLYTYGFQCGLSYTVLRYSNVYGARQNPKGEAGVVAIFVGQMLGGEHTTIFGSGDKTRDYIHVSDVVAANLLAMKQECNAVYNIGTGVETSDQKMFDTIANLIGYSESPTFAPVRDGEIQRIYLDATKAQREMGWRVKFPIQERLPQTIEFYKNNFTSK